MVKADKGVTTTDELAPGASVGSNATDQHLASDEIKRAAQQQDLRGQNAAGGGDLPASDYAKRHDIPPDDHPTRKVVEMPEREASEAATKAAIAKHGVGVDLNAPDPVAEKAKKDAEKDAKAHEAAAKDKK